MKLIAVSLVEAQRRWADIKHLHSAGGWPQDKVPEWVYDVLRDHYPAEMSLGQIGIGAVEHTALCDMVESLLAHARAFVEIDNVGDDPVHQG